MKHLGTAFWFSILGISAFAIGAGFLSGRSLQRAAALPAIALAETIPPPMQRSLFGARGAGVPLEPYQATVDEVVVTRPPGWAPERTPSQREPVRLAIVIRGIGEDRTIDARFKAIPFPLTFAVAAVDDTPPERLRSNPRALLVDTDPPVSPEQVTLALTEFGAGGVLSALSGTPQRPGPIVKRLLGTDAFAVDGMAGGSPSLYDAAHAQHVAAATRDVVIDAHEEEAYVAYMLRQAAKLARRSGVAIAVGHAYPQTYEALRLMLPRIVSEDIEIVPVGDLVR